MPNATSSRNPSRARRSRTANPPEEGNLQALFAERVNAVLEPVAQALQAAFVAAPPAVEAPPDRQLAWFADDPPAVD